MKNKSDFINVSNLGFDNFKLKIEGYNQSGSIKLKTAIALLEQAENHGKGQHPHKIIESSSGNLGVALAALTAQRGYSFTCVIDPNTSPQNRKIMEAFGTKIICVTEKDSNGGYLGTRIRTIQEMQKKDSSLYWTNQYKSRANPDIHYRLTGPETRTAFKKVDYVIIGAGTTGTLMGVARYFKQHSPSTHIVAVDTVGSVTFGSKPSQRFIPGLGTSRLPEIYEDRDIDTKILVDELSAVQMCRWFAATHGFLLGGSTGSVLASAVQLKSSIPSGANIVAISPDLGERYLDTVYSDSWVTEVLGEIPPVFGTEQRIRAL